MRQLLLITRKYLRSFLKCRLYFLKIEVKHCSYKKSAVLNSVTLMQKSAMSKNSVTFTNLEAVARSLFRSSFEANLEAVSVSLSIWSKCREIQTRKNSIFEHFSRSVTDEYSHK